MRQFLSFFRQFLKPLANSNTCIFVNIAWKINCDILKSKLILCEWNAFYFIEIIAFIGFTLHQIKQCIVFLGTPGIYIYMFIYIYVYIYIHIYVYVYVYETDEDRTSETFLTFI